MMSDNLQDSSSVMESVCIDDEVFFGPITDKEQMIRERFETRMQAKNALMPPISSGDMRELRKDSPNECKNDSSNSSNYESFSVEESKYESFEDSLDGRSDSNPQKINASHFLSEQVNVNVRRLHAQHKNITSYLCDSLEDIHSLVSNADRFSNSEEIEDVYVMERSQTCDDSLRNDACMGNRNPNGNEQCFDDDSLAILEFEKTFDDSLEESSFLPLSHIDSLILSRNKIEDDDVAGGKHASDNSCTAKNHFETSIEVIYENSEHGINEVVNSNSKVDAQSISECNLFRDSLEDLNEISYPDIPKARATITLMSDGKSNHDFSSEINSVNESHVNITDVDETKFHTKMVTSPKFAAKPSHSNTEQNTHIGSNILNFNDTIYIDDYIMDSDSVLNPVISNFTSRSDINGSNMRSTESESNSKTSAENIAAPNFNDTICIDDSMISQCDDILRLPIKKFTSECFTSSNEMGITKLESKFPKFSNDPDSNDTVFIDDSIILPSDPVLKSSNNFSEFSMISQDIAFKVENNHMLSPKALNAPMSNDTICIEDSIIFPSDPVLKSSNNFSELFMVSQDRAFKVENNHMLSPKALNAPMSNDTICIEDSIIFPSDTVLKSSNNFSEFFMISQDRAFKVENHHMLSPKALNAPMSNDTICIEDSIIFPSDTVLSPSINNFISNCNMSSNQIGGVGNKCANPQKSLNAPNYNDNICIDEFAVLTPDPVSNKKENTLIKEQLNHQQKTIDVSNSIEKDFQELKINVVDKQHVAFISNAHSFSPLFHKNTNSCIDSIIWSPLKECHKSNACLTQHSTLKNETDFVKKASVSEKCTSSENNLNLHIEVAFDENRGVNTISVSSLEQGVSPKINLKMMEVGGSNKSSELNCQGKDVNIPKHQAADTLKATDTTIRTKSLRKGRSSDSTVHDLSNYPKEEKNCPNKYSNELHIKLGMHNAKLLQALDLHDTSYNFNEGGYLQSRDSIMPLNLCIRDKSAEKRIKSLSRNESKENIPFILPAAKFPVKEFGVTNNKFQNSPKGSKGTPLKNNKNTKQVDVNTDVKKSGWKSNSTKIPIRKMDNLSLTPSSQQKVKQDFKTIKASKDKPAKSPFLVPASSAVALHREVSEETPKKPHHFCMVRNSISKVPKSAQKVTLKKFQNIQSPIARYIGYAPVFTPLKTTHRYDGNLLLANMTPVSQTASKHTYVGSFQTPASMKADKK